MPKKRGRFDVVFVFKSGAWMRATSDKTRSISASEAIEQLRGIIKTIEAGVKAENRGQKVTK